MKTLAAARALAALLIIAAFPVSALAGDEAHEWLERLSAAMSQMSYQGTFVYVQGDEVDTMRITHVADENGVRERLVSVSGSEREVLRDADGVRWVQGDDHSVMQDSAFGRSFFPELPIESLSDENSPYLLKLGESGRIAGHTGRKLEIIPADKYRYGYRLWLEEHSALLLKWELLASKGKSLAKLMFTDLKLGSMVDVKELESTSRMRQYKTQDSHLPTDKGLAHASPRWQPSSLPPGFRLTAHRYKGLKEEGVFEHLVYSDGIAAVSVYVESGAGMKSVPGLSRLGTTHAYSRSLDDVTITVVGDVPAITVKTIGNAIEPSRGKPDKPASGP
jgi:sigma-E factor negative regulatory protein RseB